MGRNFRLIRDRAEIRGANIAASLASPDPALLNAPLAYFTAEHARHRFVCSILRGLAKNDVECQIEVGQVSTYLMRDLPLHHRDKEQDFFPALERRALKDDNLGPLLAELRDNHRQAESLAQTLVAALDRRLGVGPDPDLLMLYPELQSRHIAVEASIVLPIARIRLRHQDLQALSCAMKARRAMRP